MCVARWFHQTLQLIEPTLCLGQRAVMSKLQAQTKATIVMDLALDIGTAPTP